MNPNQALWEKGDFTVSPQYARQRRGARQGNRHYNRAQVLDLGCGDGTTALPAARLERTC